MAAKLDIHPYRPSLANNNIVERIVDSEIRALYGEGNPLRPNEYYIGKQKCFSISGKVSVLVGIVSGIVGAFLTINGIMSENSSSTWAGACLLLEGGMLCGGGSYLLEKH